MHPKVFKQFSAAMPIWLRDKLFQKKQLLDALNEIGKEKFDPKIFFRAPHESRC